MRPAAPTPQASGKRSRALLLSILAGGLILLGGLAYLLATFDFNDFRDELGTLLSERLSLPVRIGSIDYRLHEAALSLHVTELQVGTPDTPLELKVPELWFDLLWRSLWRRELRFSKITLDHPALRLQISSDGGGRDRNSAGSADAQPFEPTLLGVGVVRALEIIDGAAEIGVPGNEPHSLRLSGVNGTLAEVGRERLSTLALDGDLRLPGQKASSPFELQTRIDLGSLTGDTVPAIDLDLQIARLDVPALQKILPVPTPAAGFAGRADLDLQVAGLSPQAARFSLAIKGPDLTFAFAGEEHEPVPVGHLTATGRWQHRQDRYRLEDLAVDFDGGHLGGTLAWQGRDPDSIAITLRDSTVTTTALQWLPPAVHDQHALLTRLERKHGEVRIEEGQAFYAPGAEASADRWRLETLHARVRDLTWARTDTMVVHLQDLETVYQGKALQLIHGKATLGTTPLSFQGSVDLQNPAEGQLGLTLNSTVTPGEIVARLGFAVDGLDVAGKVPVRGELHGPLRAPKLDLRADLHTLHVSSGSDLDLEPGPQDYLVLNCALDEQALTIEHAGLQWSILEGHFSGRLPYEDPAAVNISGTLSIPDLADTARVSPLLGKTALGGRADLAFSMQGVSPARLPDLEMTLRDVSVATGKAVADLNRINGRIRFTEKGFVAERLQAQLGESPLQVEARLDDYRTPVLELLVEAQSIRADDLIFPSDLSVLRDVRGRLRIDRQGISLDPVTLTLGQKTRPVIHGLIRTDRPVRADLDITADFAEIGEIIGLWTELTPAARKAREAEKHRPTGEERPQVTIRARAAEGELYGMRFHDAAGTITPTGEGLVIHPLDFHVGDGFCNAQVLVDRRPEGAPLLRISGHAEDVDALEVYRELLRQENIVRGRLRGDFYVQGLVGRDYLPTSYGRFDIEIRDGVLHKFQVLSKVFSLLNVSQLFAFQLPDMDREGMPFHRLTANLSLDQGILHSDNLVIRSDAMNQAYQGDFDLVHKELDLVMAVHPLGTVDKVVSRLPVAGWLLTGEDKALVTAHFAIKGPVKDVRVTPVPITSLSDQTIGLLRRTLQLPFKLIEDPKIIWGGQDTAE